MPDLGQYASPVLWSYGISLALIFGFWALSVKKQLKIRKELKDMESHL